MKHLRKQFIEWLFEISQKVYTNMFKNHEPWGMCRAELLNYPEDSIGNHLGIFLDKNNFELISKLERHDAYHTITDYGIRVQDEIALQCFCYGNGKRSLYLYGAIVLGIIILPDYSNYYYRSYHIGKNVNAFHHFDYKKLLKINIHDFRKAIFTNTEINQLTILQYGQI